MKTDELVLFLDDLLNIRGIVDSSMNGLQVGNSGNVNKFAYSVDASIASFEKAAEMNADFIFVHHGIFWGDAVPITGSNYKRIKFLLDNDIALYAAHLPLDIHPELGNNSQIKRVLDWDIVDDFGLYHGISIGKMVEFKPKRSLDTIVDEIKIKLGCNPVVWNFGSNEICKAAYVSGDAISMLDQAIDIKADLYITGEPAHSAFWKAKEAVINVIFCGHYVTETLGVEAIAKKIRNKFEIDTAFIDLPTGY